MRYQNDSIGRTRPGPLKKAEDLSDLGYDKCRIYLVPSMVVPDIGHKRTLNDEVLSQDE